MNRKVKILRIYIIILCLYTLLGVILRSAAALSDFSGATGYYEDKLLINAASVIITCGSILMFTYVFIADKKRALIATFSTPETYIPTGVVSVALVFFFIRAAARFSGLTEAGVAKGQETMVYYILMLLVVLSLVSIAYYVANAFVTERSSTSRAALGLANVLLLALYASYLYFDTKLTLNSPNKIVDQIAFLLAALFFLYETRISLSREKWHLYIAFGMMAASIGAYSSIPSLVVYFAKGELISDSIEENVLMLCITFFIFSRILLAASYREDAESEFVFAMKEAAEEREAYISEKEEAERRAYIEVYNRISELAEEEPDPIEYSEPTESTETAESLQASEPEDSFAEEEALPNKVSFPDEDSEPEEVIPVYPKEEANEALLGERISTEEAPGEEAAEELSAKAADEYVISFGEDPSTNEAERKE